MMKPNTNVFIKKKLEKMNACEMLEKNKMDYRKFCLAKCVPV